MIDKDTNVNGQAKDNEEIQEVDEKNPGVDDTEEIPGVDNIEEIPGVDDETPGMEDGHKNEAKPDKIKDNSV